jgi:replicative DNA helicase
MTIGIEKLFFGYILQNKKYFSVVEGFYFKNSEIQFVYNIIKKYMTKGGNIEIPSPKQILEMVSLEDKDGMITKEILKSMLIINLTEYDEVNFLIPKFNAWILSNKIKAGTVDIIDETRNLDGISDLQDTMDTVNKIKNIVETMSNVNFLGEDDDMGSDFDDVESHVQDNSKYKISTGIKSLDQALDGGFDIITLTTLMCESGGGKSIWMQNLTTNCANLGYNVLYVSLEMSERKVFKRIGSMRLRIPINEYDNISKDVEYMRKRIESLKNSTTTNDIFEKKIGKIFCKFWAAGTATCVDIDNSIQKLQDRKGIKIDLIVIDYLTLLITPKTNSGGDTLYTKGKLLAEGARALGAKYKCPVITAVQVAKEAWGSNDLSLSSVPESKAIVETSDLFLGIIRSPEMQKQNLYRLKILKQRDGGFLNAQIRINMNPMYLNLENDTLLQ